MKESDFRNDVLPLKNKLFRLALRITLKREEAEDIVQETLLKVWKCMNEGKDIDNIEAFAMTACRNMAIDASEKKEKQNISLDEAMLERQDTAHAPDEVLMEAENEHIVTITINSLPEKQRTAIQLREIEGKTYKEIALIMELTEADVKVNIFRARKRIKEILTKTHRHGL